MRTVYPHGNEPKGTRKGETKEMTTRHPAKTAVCLQNMFYFAGGLVGEGCCVCVCF